MKVGVICQDEPLYLSDSLKLLFESCQDSTKISSVFLLNHSANGKKESFILKAINVIKIFGLKYFLYLSWRFIAAYVGGRPRISEVCAKYNVNCVSVVGSINEEPNISVLEGERFDVLISIAGSQIFRDRALKAASRYFLNVHNAMLPKCRGLMPVFWTLYNQEDSLGVSVFQMDEGIDSGPILKQVEIPIQERSLDKAIKATKNVGMTAVSEVLKDISDGSEVLLQNDDRSATYFSFPTKNDVKEFIDRGNKLL